MTSNYQSCTAFDPTRLISSLHALGLRAIRPLSSGTQAGAEALQKPGHAIQKRNTNDEIFRSKLRRLRKNNDF
jgi:hypothetical protein